MDAVLQLHVQINTDITNLNRPVICYNAISSI